MRETSPVASFPTRVANASLKSDFSKMRKASAFRRGGVVLAVTFAAYLYSGTAMASHVAITAMFVGQLDRGGSPKQEWHWMAGATVMMAGVSVLASSLAGHEVILLGVMALIAFWAGASIGVNPRAPAALLYTTAVLAAALIQPAAPGHILATGVASLIAGGIQTALTALTAPLIGYMPERRAVADALTKLGAQFLAVSREKESAAATISAFTGSLNKAEKFLSDSDISGDARRRFVDILATADILAREARSYFSRAQADVGRPTDATTMEHFELVGLALVEAAAALQTFKPEANLAELDILIEELESISETAESATATNIASSAEHLASGVKAVMDSPKIHRGHRERSLSTGNRIRASVSPGSIPLKHGLRLASAAIAGMVIASLLGLNHGSWVAVTMIMLLRPDAGPALTRFVSRSIGNILGATIVVGIAVLVGGSNPELILAIGLSSTLLFIVMPVNYTWAAMFSSMTAILALTIGGEHTATLAVERLTDVLLGCLLGVIWAFLFPIWQRTNLPTQCVNYLKRSAKWTKTCSNMALLPPTERGELIDKARRQATKVRAARQSLSVTLDASLVEPPTKQVDIHAISRIMRHMRDCNHAVVAAEHMLAHGSKKSKPAAKEALRTASEIRLTSNRVKNPKRRDSLTITFDELELNMSETGTLDVVAVQDLAAEQKRIKADRKGHKKKKKKSKSKKLKNKGDVAVVLHGATKAAHRAHLAAESSKLNYESFL